MKQILELVPIILFFVVYKFSGTTVTVAGWSHELDGIFSATAVLMIATLLQAALLLLVYKTLAKRELWTIVAVIAFGALTLSFRNELFIQWKPTIFNWALAVVFLIAPYFANGKTLLEKTIGTQLHAPHAIWRRLNLFWCLHFTVVGALNLYIAYGYEESTWVSYKLYSAIGFTVLLSVITLVILGPHIKQTSDLKG